MTAVNRGRGGQMGVIAPLNFLSSLTKEEKILGWIWSFLSYAPLPILNFIYSLKILESNKGVLLSLYLLAKEFLKTISALLSFTFFYKK